MEGKRGGGARPLEEVVIWSLPASLLALSCLRPLDDLKNLLWGFGVGGKAAA